MPTPRATADTGGVAPLRGADEEELAEAFDTLAARTSGFDAVIVDEGQDFREEWWLLIEAALASTEFGVLYVFHDDNQALLPYRSRHPLLHAPVPLSKNCRNAGEVFDFVRAFHARRLTHRPSFAGKGSFDASSSTIHESPASSPRSLTKHSGRSRPRS